MTTGADNGVFSLFLFFLPSFFSSKFEKLGQTHFLNNSGQWTHFTTVSKRKENNYSLLQTTEAGSFCNVTNIRKTSEVLIVWLCVPQETLGGGGVRG